MSRSLDVWLGYVSESQIEDLQDRDLVDEGDVEDLRDGESVRLPSSKKDYVGVAIHEEKAGPEELAAILDHADSNGSVRDV